jgi:hypothetical protein
LKRLIAYRQGTLPAAEREALQEHLSLCSRCSGLLLELRDFQSAVARGEAGPEGLRQEAWESLVRKLPVERPVVRPIAGAARREAQRPRRAQPILAVAAAALLLAVAGLAVWAMVAVRQQSQRLVRLERQLDERDAALAAAARESGQPAGREDELAARVAGLTASLVELQRTTQRLERRSQIAAASGRIEVAVAPRFALRGQEAPDDGGLRGGGEANAVRMPREDDRFAVTLRLPEHRRFEEYRLELVDRSGKVLWTGRRPSRSVLGDSGTSVSVSGLGPGLYRLRIEGVSPERSELLGEYALDVLRPPSDG